MFIMRRGESEYFRIVKTLGRINVAAVPSTEVLSSKFGMRITKIDENDEYGTHKFYQIELFEDGQYHDITIENISISYIIKSKVDYYRTYREFTNTITINYGDVYGNISQLVFPTKVNKESADGRLLYKILYAIILISEVRNPDLLKNLCILILSDDSFMEVGKAITTIKESKNIIANIKEKYPFMIDIINSSMELRKIKIMEELYNLEISN